MMLGITDSVVVITGGASGIGRGAAEIFARHGAAVGLLDRDEDGVQEIAASLRARGVNAYAAAADVMSEVQVEEGLARIEAHLGDIDHAFNAAGIRGTAKPVTEMTVEEFRTVIDVNLFGTFVTMRAQLRRMTARGRGQVVNCASVTGFTGGGLGSAQYAASKHGVIGLTKTVALEAIGSGVRVNAIAPGFVETGMTLPADSQAAAKLRANYARMIPAARSGLAEEMGEAVAWMCSDSAAYLVGHVMVLDGGMTTGLHAIMR